MPGDLLADRVLDLEPRVHLHEVEGLVAPEQALDRARVAVARRAHGTERGVVERAPRLLAEERRGRLLEQLLVPALDAALALADDQRAARTVAHHLHLDVVRVDDDLLQVQPAVAERRLGLGRGRRVGRLELRRLGDRAHAAPAAARGRLEQHRIADLAGDPAGLVHAGQAALGAGHERHAGRAHGALGEGLVAQHLHRLGRRADEDQVVLLAGRTNDGLSERKP